MARIKLLQEACEVRTIEDVQFFLECLKTTFEVGLLIPLWIDPIKHKETLDIYRVEMCKEIKRLINAIEPVGK